MKVLVVMGHPRQESFCAALANAYLKGASDAGASVHMLALPELVFDPNVRFDSPENQTLEPSLQRAAELLAWADHLVFVYPTWWGTMPALLKGFLDRLLMPGIAFRYYGPGASDFEGLWTRKTGQIITTMDTPSVIYRWVYKAPGTHAMRNATLGFCGVKPVDVMAFGPLRTSTSRQREAWLEKSRRAGWKLHDGVGGAWARRWAKAMIWLRALRLQFYPMTWGAYTLGALLVFQPLEWAPYVWGYLAVFLMEAATVFCNDYFDVDSDRANRNFGPFTGGSRILVDELIGPAELRQGAGLALILAAVCAAFAVRTSPQPLLSALWLLPATILTLGYTVPPLRLCYRGLGELDVAFTHGALVLFMGYLLQGGAADASIPWVLALPLFFAILPAIILAGVPDRDADASVNKRTVAVLLGTRAAVIAAAVGVFVAAVLAILFDLLGMPEGLYRNISYFVLPHAGLCLLLLVQAAQHAKATEARRIDLLLVASLSYMIWFVAVPFYHLI